MGRMGRTGALLVAAVVVSATLELGVGSPPVEGAAAGAPPVAGALYSWGISFDGQLGNHTFSGPATCADGATCSPSPVEVSLPAGVTPVAVAGGGNSGYAIGSDGNLYGWGERPVGDGTAVNRTHPVRVLLPSGVGPTAIAGGVNSGYAIGDDGRLYGWGSNWAGQLASGSERSSLTPAVITLPGGATPVAIAASNATAYALGSDGRLYAWGDDAQGEVGNGATSSKDATPTPVPFPSGVTPVAVAAGQAAAYAVGSDGNLYAWGDNYWGELGIGAAAGPDSCSGVPCSTVPVRVVLPAGVSPRSVAAGAGSAYVLGSDATIYAWGDNGAGQVGDGTSGSDPVLAPVPVSLPPGTDPTGVAAGGYGDGFAIGSGGELYAWGSNSTGQLAVGFVAGPQTCAVDEPPYSFACSPEPVLVPLPGPVRAIAAPFDGGYAIAAAGIVGPSTTLHLVSSRLRSVAVGHPANFRATVSAPDGRPQGTVQFSVDGTPWGPPEPLTVRHATTTVTSLPVGTDTVGAAFSSTNGFLPSSASVTQVVVGHRSG